MRKRLLAALLAISGFGCSDSSAPGHSDTEKPVDTRDASSDSQVAVEVTSKLRVIQGRPARTAVKLTRTGTPGSVELSLSGLPAGVVSPAVTASAEQSEVEIVFEASSDSVQGTRVDAVVTAKTGDYTTNARINLHITGAPGTPDLSFGPRGIVSVQPPGLEEASTVTVRALAVEETGQTVVYYGPSSVTKFDAKGALDLSFGLSGRIDPNEFSVSGCFDHRPCLFLEPDSKILILNHDGFARRYWTDGGVDLSFGTAGYLQWSDGNDFRWAASPTVVDGQRFLLDAGSRSDQRPFVERIGLDGARDSRFDATAALACQLGTCLYPLALGARADGSVLYASYPGVSGTGTLDVRLTELSSTGASRFTSPVLFAASGSHWADTKVFILPDVGSSTVVFGLDDARKLTAAKVSASGALEVVRRLEIESASFPECDSFGIWPAPAGRLTAFCTVDETREVRLLRLTPALQPDEDFAPGGLVVGYTNGSGARVALGPDETIVVAAERKLSRLWN